jgi:phage portal protein BeeE
MLVSAGLKRAEFEERHLANGIFPGIGLKFPEGKSTRRPASGGSRPSRRSTRAAARPGKVIGVGGGAELIPIPISLEDAQFAEATRLTIEQAAAMYQVPISFFTGKPTEAEWRMFITFALGPVLEATGQAFAADRDLFDVGLDGERLRRRPAP